jgi:hypothetical protein
MLCEEATESRVQDLIEKMGVSHAQHFASQMVFHWYHYRASTTLEARERHRAGYNALLHVVRVVAFDNIGDNEMHWREGYDNINATLAEYDEWIAHDLGVDLEHLQGPIGLAEKNRERQL